MQNSPLPSITARQHALPSDLDTPRHKHVSVVVALGAAAVMIASAFSLALFWLLAVPAP